MRLDSGCLSDRQLINRSIKYSPPTAVPLDLKGCAPMDLFDPATYASVRRPVREAETLPIECYIDEKFYQREVETIFKKIWNCVGREDFAKNPADYFTRNVVGSSLIIIHAKYIRILA